LLLLFVPVAVALALEHLASEVVKQFLFPFIPIYPVSIVPIYLHRTG